MLVSLWFEFQHRFKVLVMDLSVDTWDAGTRAMVHEVLRKKIECRVSLQCHSPGHSMTDPGPRRMLPFRASNEIQMPRYEGLHVVGILKLKKEVALLAGSVPWCRAGAGVSRGLLSLSRCFQRAREVNHDF
ncbi:hypothetical protein E2C01_015767 [Portunus trituberculatus]|uniref:Uncharacterized protein n=1 Tax=Portunus trituberculatus TaxID=210409 RepID=A0A5B7DNI0_PORTR|nr:hypothetical protein [Portunus trituberculatus]